MSNWKTIDSAPKDGTWFLGYWPECNDPEDAIIPSGWDCNAPDGARFVDVRDQMQEHPSHWQPLTEPEGETHD